MTAEHVEKIAVVGMAARFPGAASIPKLWRNLSRGVETISRFSDKDLAAANVTPEMLQQPNYVRAKAVIDDAEQFDAKFFGYSPREAQLIDPQQRVLLECAFEAMEEVGGSSRSYEGDVGVFVGVGMNTYLEQIMLDSALTKLSSGYQLMISNDKDFAAMRIAYALNLTGPALTVQTACSTSLVAIERACQSLINYECDMALAGGASVGFPQKTGYLYEEGMILSPDGHCRPFDAEAKGTVPGEGAAIVALKRLGAAIQDGDLVHAVVCGWATNNDGSQKVGFTAPGVDGQAQVIATAMGLAGFTPDSIDYVEAHGTATPLGDPIEVQALAKAFAGRRCGRCIIGSIKSNFGHTDVAAGAAGFIKTVLALKHRSIPATLHFKAPNPQIDFDSVPFRVAARRLPWPAQERPRRAGVSSFGIGGTNAHVVLEEAPAASSRPSSRQFHVFVYSAKSKTALDHVGERLVDHLSGNPMEDFADVAFTLQTGRDMHEFGRVVVCKNRQDAVTALKRQAELPIVRHRDAIRSAVFMFPGQGSQHVGMARDLYETEPFFQQQLDKCLDLLDPHLAFDLEDVLYPQPQQLKVARRQLRETQVAQPALFAIEYALAQLWIYWGVKPAAMIGHSIGEFVAACLAGVFSLSDALAIIAKRAELMQESPQGAMLAVALDEERTTRLIPKDLTIAACNSPNCTVVAGSNGGIESFALTLQSHDIAASRLEVSHAYHSATMKSASAQLAAFMSSFDFGEPSIPLVSCKSGKWISAQSLGDVSYWADQMLQPVQFARGIKELLRFPEHVYLEVGPGHTLCSFVREAASASQHVETRGTLPRSKHAASSQKVLLETAGSLCLLGFSIDWSRVHRCELRKRTSLPAYPFERVSLRPNPSPSKREHETTAPLRDLSRSLYSSVWTSCSVSQDALRPKGVLLGASALVFLDETGLGRRLVDELAEVGVAVLTVSAGTQFQVENDGHFTIAPQTFKHYVRLFDVIAKRGSFTQHIIHLWSVTRPVSPAPSSVLELGFLSITYVAQALGCLKNTQPVQLDIVSNGVHRVQGRDRVCTTKATLLGPRVVIPQEYVSVRCRSIDLEADELERQQDRSLHLLKEDLTREDTPAILAYRDGKRWVHAVQPLTTGLKDDGQQLLQQGRNYLIIGGLGQIGLALAEAIAGHVSGRLVLCSRRKFPSRTKWAAWIDAHQINDPTSQVMKRLLAMEQIGTRITIVRADVCQEAAFRQAVRQFEMEHGLIHGVVHCAGRLETVIIHHTKRKHIDTQFQAKLQGLPVLIKTFAGRTLDFVVLSSSLSSYLGGLGFSTYAAANCFLDSVAIERSASDPTPWLSIGWDGWVDESGSDGLVADTSSSAITREQGAWLFQTMLSLGLRGHVLVSATDLHQRAINWVHTENQAELAVANQAEQRSPRPNISTDYRRPLTHLQRSVVDVWQAHLGLQGIGIDDNFFELGGNSLMAGQVIIRLREVLDVPLSIRHLFENPTASLLVRQMVDNEWVSDTELPPDRG